MSHADKLKKRKQELEKREERGARRRVTVKAKKYYFASDGTKTEANYIKGLIASLPERLRKNISPEYDFKHTNSEELVMRCLERVAKNPEMVEKWLIVDKDRLENFDETVASAEAKDIKVAWSNPCIEQWFAMYFGEVLSCTEPKQCIKHFSKLFKEHTGQGYKKSDKNIYKKLMENGDETEAIRLAEKTYDRCKKFNENKPSQMHRCTTLYELVKELKGISN